jgi:hypothetical protein
VSSTEQEIMIPGLELAITKEMLYGTVKNTHRNIKGMLALKQQFYFSSLNMFREVAKTDEESMIKIISMHPDKKELVKKLSLAGVTQVDIVVTPGTVEVCYPQYDSRWEYRDIDMYNTVYIENLSEHPVLIIRIEKEGDAESELLLVRKKDSWSMKEWSEVLLYPHEGLFEERVNILLTFFGILQENYDYAITSFYR